MFYIFSLIFIFATPCLADLKTFGPVSITLPQNWGCQKEVENYICIDESSESERNTAIVITYKFHSPEDSLAVYRDQLARPRKLVYNEVIKPSQPVSVNEIVINNITWIEGVHIGSEILNFMTHYYATVAGSYAVLVTLTINQAVYEETLEKLKPIMQTLSVRETVFDTSTSPKTNNFSSTNQIKENTEIAEPRVGIISIFGLKIRKGIFYLCMAVLVLISVAGYAILND